jgi:hypothetical protein
VTEAQWLAATDPEEMLAFLRDCGKASDRKLRLFTCACCRAVWGSLAAERSRRAVETAERYADGLATDQDLHRAHSQAFEVARQFWQGMGLRRFVRRGYTPEEGRLLLAGEVAHAHTPFLIGRLGWLRSDEELKAVSPALLRCVFAKPVGAPPRIDPAWHEWNSGLVVRLAQAAYEERLLPAGHLHPARLAVLADALEDAGCSDPDILGHLRGRARM